MSELPEPRRMRLEPRMRFRVNEETQGVEFFVSESVAIWAPGSRSRKPEALFVGDTPAEALRAAALWFDEGCPDLRELARVQHDG